QNRQYYTILNQFETENIKKTSRGILNRRVLEKVEDKQCILGIFFYWPQTVKHHCKYDIAMQPTEQKLHYVGDDRFMMSGIQQYTEHCANTSVLKTGCRQCIIELEHGCTL